eukprot:2619165-Amphidinium_carterae.1
MVFLHQDVHPKISTFRLKGQLQLTRPVLPDVALRSENCQPQPSSSTIMHSACGASRSSSAGAPDPIQLQSLPWHPLDCMAPAQLKAQQDCITCPHHITAALDQSCPQNC